MPFSDLEDSLSSEPASPTLAAARERAPSLTGLPPEHPGNEGCAQGLHFLGMPTTFSPRSLADAEETLAGDAATRQEFERICNLKPMQQNRVRRSLQQAMQIVGQGNQSAGGELLGASNTWSNMLAHACTLLPVIPGHLHFFSFRLQRLVPIVDKQGSR
jgi:hypothetical protein